MVLPLKRIIGIIAFCGFLIAPEVGAYLSADRAYISHRSVPDCISRLPWRTSPTRPRQHAGQTYQEVHIPFFVRRQLIFVMGRISGRQVPCLVDTGTANIVWPQRLQLGGARIPVIYKSSRSHRVTAALTGPTGEGIQGQLCRLPLIDVEGYRLGNIDTICLSKMYPAGDQDGSNYLVLGNSAFRRVVLTIDYRKRELTIRTRGYDLRKLDRLPGSHLFRYQWIDQSPLTPGRPVICATVKGAPRRVVLDTGLSSVMMTEAASRHLPRVAGRFAYMMGAFNTPRRILYAPDVPISIGGAKLPPQTIAIIPGLDVGADGSIGMPLLRAGRLTIDYTRPWMLFEPYRVNR